MLGPWFWLSYIGGLQTSAALHKYADGLTVHQRIQKDDIEIEISLDSKVTYIDLKQNHDTLQKSYIEISLDPKVMYIDLKQNHDTLQKSYIEISAWCAKNNMAISTIKTKVMTIQLPHTKKSAAKRSSAVMVQAWKRLTAQKFSGSWSMII